MQRMAEFGNFSAKAWSTQRTRRTRGNRIGVYAMMLTMHQMLESGLSIEVVDKITGKPWAGRAAPPSARVIWWASTRSCTSRKIVWIRCPRRSAQHLRVPEFVRDLVAQGRLGRKSSAGFYKEDAHGSARLRRKDQGVPQPRKGALRFPGAIKNEEDPKKRLKKLVSSEDVAGKFAWTLLAKTLIYSARRLGEIADDIVSIDQAMRWGFNWDLGRSKPGTRSACRSPCNA